MESQQMYISEFGTVLLFIVGSTVFLLITFLISRLLRPQRPNEQKLAAYESGEQAISSAWPQFNIRFYVVAIMFLLFEIELVFLFPWATVFSDAGLQEVTSNQWGWFTLVEVAVFVIILALGLGYAWANGYLEWAQGKQEVSTVTTPVPKNLYEQINERYKKHA
jgi:NADH-quinone oxidoreductase subunit A